MLKEARLEPNHRLGPPTPSNLAAYLKNHADNILLFIAPLTHHGRTAAPIPLLDARQLQSKRPYIMDLRASSSGPASIGHLLCFADMGYTGDRDIIDVHGTDGM